MCHSRLLIKLGMLEVKRDVMHHCTYHERPSVVVGEKQMKLEMAWCCTQCFLSMGNTFSKVHQRIGLCMVAAVS